MLFDSLCRLYAKLSKFLSFLVIIPKSDPYFYQAQSPPPLSFAPAPGSHTPCAASSLSRVCVKYSLGISEGMR